jgi:hypothetical protein
MQPAHPMISGTIDPWLTPSARPLYSDPLRFYSIFLILESNTDRLDDESCSLDCRKTCSVGPTPDYQDKDVFPGA